jgi:hypothetical protein
VDDATRAIENDGSTFGGNITVGGTDAWFVNGQTPSADLGTPRIRRCRSALRSTDLPAAPDT